MAKKKSSYRTTLRTCHHLLLVKSPGLVAFLAPSFNGLAGKYPWNKNCLVVSTLSLWKIWVSWDDDIPFPRWWESHNPANNPAMFQSPPTRISCHIKSQYIPILIQYCSSYTPNKFFRCGPQEVNSAPWNHQPANQLHQFPLSFPFHQSMESWPSPSNTPTWARLWPAPTQHSAGGLEIPWNGWIPDLSWSKYPLVN